MKNASRLAVHAGFPKIVELLVGYGANLNEADEIETCVVDIKVGGTFLNNISQFSRKNNSPRMEPVAMYHDPLRTPPPPLSACFLPVKVVHNS